MEARCIIHLKTKPRSGLAGRDFDAGGDAVGKGGLGIAGAERGHARARDHGLDGGKKRGGVGAAEVAAGGGTIVRPGGGLAAGIAGRVAGSVVARAGTWIAIGAEGREGEGGGNENRGGGARGD